MPGIGTLVNGGAVVIGGIIGVFFKKGLKQRYQDTIMQGIALSVIFIGISGSLEKMLVIKDSLLSTQGTMMIVVSLVIGCVFGEWLNLEAHIEHFGTWLKEKTGNANDTRFIQGFITASLTICVGAMAVVGSLQDGLAHDPSMLFTKAVLDGVIIMLFASAFGMGAIFSVIPLLIFQGSITAFAGVIQPFLTDSMIQNMSLIGNMLIFCIGVNLMFPIHVKVANMLPALVVVAIYSAFL
mgnify:CR=1 FL=1|jgi:hypothetical protein